MTEAAPSAPLSVTDLSARIVNETEQAKPDAAKILGWTSDLVALLGPAPSESNGQLRDDTFLVAEQRFLDLHDVPALVGLLRLRARWTGNRVGYGQECAAMLASATKDRLVQAKVASAGFGSRRPVEALDRLEFLLSLAPGVAIADRTLGYGEILREDDFYRTMEVVFDRDGAPRTIGFRFAADSFRLVPPSHVLAVRHADPEAFAKTCKERPGEVVRLVLESYEDMPVARLQSLMEDLVLPSGTEWKAFWAAARAQLAKDPSVVVPPATKKNACVELLRGGAGDPSAQAKRDAERFASSREPKEILEKAAELLVSPGAAGFSPELRAAFADRLAFVVKASVADRRLGNRAKVQALVLAREAGLSELPASLQVNDATRPGLLEGFRFTDETCAVIDLAGTLAMPEVVLDASRTLPANRLEALLRQIPLDKDPEVARAFVRALPRMTPSLVDHIAPKLLEGPASREFAELVRDQFAQDHVYDPEAASATELEEESEDAAASKADGLSLPLLRWICHAQASAKTRKAVYGIVSPFAIASLASVALGFQAEKENLRMKNDIKKLFVAGDRVSDPRSGVATVEEGTRWLVPLLKDMSEDERAAIFVRVNALEGVWEPLPPTASARRSTAT